jgi:hypothetical protein
MNGLLFCLACLHLQASTPPTSVVPKSEKDWVYIGKGVRLVSYEVNADATGRNDIFIPLHTSGFILLDEHSFSVSAASVFNTVWMQYENGTLETTEAGSSQKKQKAAMDYQPALLESLDECVDDRIGGVVKDILSKRTDEMPTATEEVDTHQQRRICEFEGSWRALKRATFLWADPKVRGSYVRVVCDFKVLLPASVMKNPRKETSPVLERRIY